MHTAYATRENTKAPNWHALVAWDVVCNNLSTGLFLAAAAGDVVLPGPLAPMLRLAYPLALAFLLIDLTLLTIDLGDPLRFHHMLRLLKVGSPMSVGVWSLTVFSLPATLAAALSVFAADGPTGAALRLVAVVGMVPALASSVYKGVLFSTTAQPVWRRARWLGAYLSGSSIMLGVAMLLGLAIILGHDAVFDVLRVAVAVLLVGSLGPLLLLAAEVRPDLRHLRNRGQTGRASALAVGGGMLLPLCLLLVPSPGLTLGAVALILIGSVTMRFAIVYAPHAAHN